MQASYSETSNKRIWIIGCGDIGRRVASLYEDFEINAVVSSSASVKLCEQFSINARALDLDGSYSLNPKDFEQAEIFYFAPPTTTGSTDKRLEYFLQKIGITAKRVVLISTTGVYGDSGGDWIDENTPVNPQADRAFRRLSAEESLQQWAEKTGNEIMILRVPGIYASDRLPLARLKKGLPVVNEKEAGFTNRIHADDLAQACKAAMDSEDTNQIINITDGNPSTMTDYFNHVADYAKLARPPQISMHEAERTLSDGMVSYLKESRRIKNEKMLSVLGINLIYPDLKSSLKLHKS
jgi:nucleoside-diphosphate-sugar epimerase